MAVTALGYTRIRSAKLDDWADYGARLLGLELVERTAAQLMFRMDDRRQRVVVTADPTEASTFGWEVADAAALDGLAGRLDGARVACRRLTAADAPASPEPLPFSRRTCMTPQRGRFESATRSESLRFEG